MEENSEDNEFPFDVSEVVKLIQERITKYAYKFKFDENEESTDQDYYLRFNCIQGWFIRCSYKTKIDFLKRCALQANDLNMLITIINSLYTISSKDRIYSLARGHFKAADMKLLADDNRCLDKATLKNVIDNEIQWFKTLNNSKQYLFLTKLISFADGLVVMNNIFAHFIDVLNIRSRQSILSKSSFTCNSRSKMASFTADQKDDKLRETIENCFQKIVPSSTTSSITKNELNTLLIKWNHFMLRYSEQMCAPLSDETIEEENISTKIDKGDAALDVIQRHPIWVTLAILNNLDTTLIMSKVNEYWATINNYFKSEITARKLLDKEIASLEGEINNIHFNKNMSRLTPEYRDKTTNITKPSLRKKFETKNIVTNYSLISEVYKDYFADFNPYSKKFQTFPRAMNLSKHKTCNI